MLRPPLAVPHDTVRIFCTSNSKLPNAQRVNQSSLSVAILSQVWDGGKCDSSELDLGSSLAASQAMPLSTSTFSSLKFAHEMTSRKRQKASQKVLCSQSDEKAAPKSCADVGGEIVTRPLACSEHSVKNALKESYLFKHKGQLERIRRTQVFEHVGDCKRLEPHWKNCGCDRILPKARFFRVLDHVQVASKLRSSPDDILDEIAVLLENKVPVGADGDMIVEIAAAFAYIVRSNPNKECTLLKHPNMSSINHVLNVVQENGGKVSLHDKDVLETLMFEFARMERLPATLHTHHGIGSMLDQYLPNSKFLEYNNGCVVRYMKYVSGVDNFHRHKYNSVRIVASRGNGYVSSHNSEYVPALYTSHGVFLRRARKPLRGVTYDISVEEKMGFYGSLSGSETEFVCAECALKMTVIADGALCLKRYDQVFMRCPLDHAFGNPVSFEKRGNAIVEMMECGVTVDSQRILLGINKLGVSIFDIVKVFRLHPQSSGIGGVWPVAVGESGITVQGREGGIIAEVTVDRASRIKLGLKGYIQSAVICGEERFANGEIKQWTKDKEKESWNSGKWARGVVLAELMG